MREPEERALSRRERQIMDALYRRGRATVSDVLEELTDPPSYSAVRTTLGVLEDKGAVRHVRDGRRFVYLPTVPRERARRNALRRLLNTFFDDSMEGAVSALLELKSADLSEAELARIQRLIDEARKEGR